MEQICSSSSYATSFWKDYTATVRLLTAVGSSPQTRLRACLSLDARRARPAACAAPPTSRPPGDADWLAPTSTTGARNLPRHEIVPTKRVVAFEQVLSLLAGCSKLAKPRSIALIASLKSKAEHKLAEGETAHRKPRCAACPAGSARWGAPAAVASAAAPSGHALQGGMLECKCHGRLLQCVNKLCTVGRRTPKPAAASCLRAASRVISSASSASEGCSRPCRARSCASLAIATLPVHAFY